MLLFILQFKFRASYRYIPNVYSFLPHLFHLASGESGRLKWGYIFPNRPFGKLKTVSTFVFPYLKDMPKQKVDEQIIIIEALKLFRKQSYFNTSMSQIADACGLQKGSLYHYFPSKEDLMRKVIKNVHEFFKTNVFNHAYDKSIPPQQRLENLFLAAERSVQDRCQGKSA